MAGEETDPDKKTLPPHRHELAHSPLAAPSERSRFCWDEERRSRAAAEEDPVQMKEVTSTVMGTESHILPALVLPWGRETLMKTKEMDSGNKGNVRVTEAMDLEDKGTEMEKGGKDPGGPVMVHSESHCCISEQEPEPCDHPGHPKSHADRQLSQTQTLLPALG